MSSSPVAVAVCGVGKSYTIAHDGPRANTLKEAIANRFRRPLGSGTYETFWAVRDLSFEVKPGEVVGIIGRNGAGKSTLLKLLSRITGPSTGEIDIFGRVASLLEVGTGFHPELTGRENIFLNGSILGMRRREIARQFDAIVDFAGVEKFLDTPVKRYSSGMYVRLAFAVAAHLEPEILIVDEVLSVGDASFQKKCLNKMEEVGSSGRTILFVSHSMPTILRLCKRVVLLDSGRLVADGEAHQVIRTYMSTDGYGMAHRRWDDPRTAPGNAVAKLRSVSIRDGRGEIAETIDIRRPFAIEVEYWNYQEALHPSVSIHLINSDGTVVFVSNDFNNRDWMRTPRKPGLVRASCQIPGNFMAEGQFSLLAAVCSYNPDEVHAIEHDAVSFQVVDRSDGDGVRGPYGRDWPGVIRPMLEWRVEPLDTSVGSFDPEPRNLDSLSRSVSGSNELAGEVPRA